MYESRAFFFRGDRKNEHIQIDKQALTVPVGHVLCAVLGLEESFFTETEEVIVATEAIQQRFLLERIGDIFRDEEIARQTVKEMKELLAQKRLFGAEAAFVFRMMVFLPCFDSYVKANEPMMRVLLNRKELGRFLTQQDDSQAGRAMTQEEYDQNQKAIKKYADQYAGWNSFLSFLEDETEELPWSIVANVIFGVENTRESYIEQLKNCVIEIKRLRSDLIGFLLQNSEESKALLFDAFPGPRVYQGHDHLTGKTLAASEKYSRIYEIVSFSEMIRAELMLLDTINREVQRCEICGKYFVPYRVSANACQRENPDYGGKTCTVIFTQRKYREQHPELDTEAGKTYLKRYKAYSKWAAEGVQFVKTYAKILYKNIVECREKTKTVTDEISKNQEAWRVQAMEALKAYSNGEISKDIAEQTMTMPRVKDRSPELAAFRKEVSHYNHGKEEQQHS